VLIVAHVFGGQYLFWRLRLSYNNNQKYKVKRWWAMSRKFNGEMKSTVCVLLRRKSGKNACKVVG
jgi:hypothetical protein